MLLWLSDSPFKSYLNPILWFLTPALDQVHFYEIQKQISLILCFYSYYKLMCKSKFHNCKHFDVLFINDFFNKRYSVWRDDASDWFQHKACHQLSEMSAVFELPWRLGVGFCLGSTTYLTLLNDSMHTRNFLIFLNNVSQKGTFSSFSQTLATSEW